jgi:hypothetical protein
MHDRPLVSRGAALRHAVGWLAEQGDWSPPLIEEACRRFDISPLDEEFLLVQYRRLREDAER